MLNDTVRTVLLFNFLTPGMQESVKVNTDTVDLK